MSIIKALGMDEIFFFDTLNPSGKDILRGLISPHLEAPFSEMVTPRYGLARLLFKSIFKFYVRWSSNISSDAWTNTFAKKYERGYILTLKIWVHIHTYTPEKTVFSRLNKEKRESAILIWKCNVHQLQPIKTNCSKLFKLKTDGASTSHHSMSHNHKL